MTGRVDEVDEERRLIDLDVVGLDDAIGGLGGVGGSVGGDLGVLGGLAGALGGLGLELLASDLFQHKGCDTSWSVVSQSASCTGDERRVGKHPKSEPNVCFA